MVETLEEKYRYLQSCGKVLKSCFFATLSEEEKVEILRMCSHEEKCAIILSAIYCAEEEGRLGDKLDKIVEIINSPEN